jgi:predicted small metal-binding protein
MKTLRCRDAGMECDAVMSGQTEEEVMKKAKEHVRSHGMAQWNDALEKKVRGLIRNQ